MRLLLGIIILYISACGSGVREPAVPEAALPQASTGDASDRANSDGEGEASPPPDSGVVVPDSNPVETPVPTPIPMTDPMVPQPKVCAPNSEVTVVKALSTQFSISGEAQDLKYEAQLVDCNGLPLAIKSQAISFDIKIYLNPQSWSYDVLSGAGAQSLANGNFSKRSGQDIFGPRQSYYLLQSSPLALQAEQTKIVFVVKIGSFSPGSSYPDAIPTFVRIGDSKPAPAPIPKAP